MSAASIQAEREIDGELWVWSAATNSQKVHLYRQDFHSSGRWMPGSFCERAHGGDQSPGRDATKRLQSMALCVDCVRRLKTRGLMP